MGTFAQITILRHRETKMPSRFSTALSTSNRLWKTIATPILIIAAILVWSAISAFLFFTEAGRLFLGGVELVGAVASATAIILGIGYGLVADKEFRAFVRSIVVLLAVGAVFVVAWYAIYSVGMTIFNWLKGYIASL